MNKLHHLVTILENNVTNGNKLNTKISNVSINWHIEHSLHVMINVINALKTSNPNNYKWKFQKERAIIFLINKIPRGKGKAPQSVVPYKTISLEELKQMCTIATNKIKELRNLQENNYFLHPYFGDLNLKASKKLLLIHTQHHIKIIQDILK